MDNYQDQAAETPVKQEQWLIRVYHDQYYQWVPVKEDEVEEDDVVTDSYFPGFKMRREVVDKPTVSTSGGDPAGFHDATNADRAAAGLSSRTPFMNFMRELEDGTWPRQFPIDSITKIEVVEGPKNLQAQLNAYLGLGENNE